MDDEMKDLVECMKRGLKENPPIMLSAKDYAAFCERLENPPTPTPALILAIEKARRMREARE